jgi:nitrogen regulatory protein PII
MCAADATMVGQVNNKIEQINKEKKVKLIEAVIRPDNIDEVKTALEQLGVEEIGVEEIMVSRPVSHDSKKKGPMLYRGAEYVADFIAKIKVEIIAADDLVGKVADTIVKIAATKRKEDCRIYILPIDETRIYFQPVAGAL